MKSKKESFAELIIVKLPLWKLFVGCLIIFSLLIGGMFLAFDVVSGKESNILLAMLIFGAIIAAGVTAMVNLARHGMDFYDEAKEIEEAIRNGEDKDEVVAKLLALDKKSFHRTTGERIRELAKMAEIKYDISLLKK
jgi:hypothetical protein